MAEPTRISWKQFKEENGLDSEEAILEFLETCTYEGIVPALCIEACKVKPDGRCEHGNPSVLVWMI